MARVFSGGSGPHPSWTTGRDGHVRPVELDVAREAILAHSGSINVDLRHAIEAVAASLQGGNRRHHQLSKVVDQYVRPLSLHAYRIHDELVANLKADGYTEQDIFEMTLIGAFGASLPAQENLFDVLYGTPGGRV